MWKNQQMYSCTSCTITYSINEIGLQFYKQLSNQSSNIAYVGYFNNNSANKCTNCKWLNYRDIMQFQQLIVTWNRKSAICVMLLYFTIESLTYGMHCLITLWPQGVFLVANVIYLIMQTMLEITFLLLVTISTVWYVFFAFNNLFFWWGEGTSKWRFWSSLVSCHVFYLLSHYFVKVINWQINWLIDWQC